MHNDHDFSERRAADAYLREDPVARMRLAELNLLRAHRIRLTSVRCAWDDGAAADRQLITVVKTELISNVGVQVHSFTYRTAA